MTSVLIVDGCCQERIFVSVKMEFETEGTAPWSNPNAQLSNFFCVSSYETWGKGGPGKLHSTGYWCVETPHCAVLEGDRGCLAL